MKSARLMFVFDDLINVDDRGMRAILKEVNNEELTIALKTASDAMRNKVLANLSERAADMIREDLEVMGPVRLTRRGKSATGHSACGQKTGSRGSGHYWQNRRGGCFCLIISVKEVTPATP